MSHGDALHPLPPICKYGDKTCPCPDGDPCHYEGKNPWHAPEPEPPDTIKTHKCEEIDLRAPWKLPT